MSTEALHTYDESQIGPLLASRIPNEPVSWGSVPRFQVADRVTEEFVEQRVQRYRVVSRQIAGDELRSLLLALRDDTEPRSILHGVAAWGPISVERLAGYLGRVPSEVEANVKALVFLDILRQTDELEGGSTTYEVGSPDNLLA
jgi:hypothetical protein